MDIVEKLELIARYEECYRKSMPKDMGPSATRVYENALDREKEMLMYISEEKLIEYVETICEE